MLTRTYIEKVSTIVSGDSINTGLNPVSELVYGANHTRMLTYFDHSKLKGMVDDKTYADVSKLRHYLKMTNAGSIDFTQLHANDISSLSSAEKVRASSFDLIFFLIPQEWDGGKGFDYTKTMFNKGYYSSNATNRLVSYDGSNWYQSQNGYPWKEEGVYSNDTLSLEYDKFGIGDGSSIIIGRQHFDIGNENINVDITETVNKFISGELKNYGIGIAFTPQTERLDGSVDNYVGFLTNKTNTFFEPYIETHYDDVIMDDRSNFILGKKNRLYLYCNVGGRLENLDDIPTCSVNDITYDVKQYSKGIYYIDICLKKGIFKPNTMLYDVWDNLVYQGEKLDAIELDFVTKDSNSFFNIGNSIESSTKLVPSIYGINESEKIFRGDVRKVCIAARVEYSKNTAELVDEMYFRLYIKDGQREIDVIPYEKVNKSYLENYVLVDTSMLIPQKYYIDVKFKYNQEMIMHHNVLSFFVVDNLNNKYA